MHVPISCICSEVHTQHTRKVIQMCTSFIFLYISRCHLSNHKGGKLAAWHLLRVSRTVFLPGIAIFENRFILCKPSVMEIHRCQGISVWVQDRLTHIARALLKIDMLMISWIIERSSSTSQRSAVIPELSGVKEPVRLYSVKLKKKKKKGFKKTCISSSLTTSCQPPTIFSLPAVT